MTAEGFLAPVASTVTASDGARLAVVEYGSGDPVLFIAGLGYSSWSWCRQVGPISERARVITVDNRGTGLSDKPPGSYSIAQMADDAYAVLTQRGARPAHVVGASMGGYIALALAHHHPDAVRSLVVVASSIGGVGARGVPASTLLAWQSAARLGPVGFARTTAPLSFARGWPEQHRGEFEDLLARRLAAPTPTSAWRAQFDAARSFLIHGLPHGRLTMPVAVVHGTDDRVVPYANAVHLVRNLPHAVLVTVEGAGHLCWIERPDTVNEVIRTAAADAA